MCLPVYIPNKEEIVPSLSKDGIVKYGDLIKLRIHPNTFKSTDFEEEIYYVSMIGPYTTTVQVLEQNDPNLFEIGLFQILPSTKFHHHSRIRNLLESEKLSGDVLEKDMNEFEGEIQ
jgi:hypothetical protein